METASGFLLAPDSTFQFFYSYGALDRYGSGTWKVEDSFIVFNSRPRPRADFKLLSSKTTSDNFITVKISDPNTALLGYVQGTIKSSQGEQRALSNSKGVIRFNTQPIDSIVLMFQFCPEKLSSFYTGDKKANYFEFGFEPWLAEVFFDAFKLVYKKKFLTGGHPAVEGDTLIYEKQ